jgi:hypothetical protein
MVRIGAFSISFLDLKTVPSSGVVSSRSQAPPGQYAIAARAVTQAGRLCNVAGYIFVYDTKYDRIGVFGGD